MDRRLSAIWLLGLILLTGCAASASTGIPSTLIVASSTPAQSPIPRLTRTPIPEPVLDPYTIWIAADGPGSAVVELDFEGESRVIPLPLNEGQTATDVIASRDGRHLAYLVWEADAQGEQAQKGIASWTLIEANARLIALPQEGYRVIDMRFAENGERLLFVQTDADAAHSKNQRWRLESIPAGGGTSTLLLDQEAAPGIVWPLPLGWPDPAGSLYLHASARSPDQNPVLAGVYEFKPDTGDLLLVTPTEDPLVIDAVLSPDGRRVAYLPGHGVGETDVVRVRDLDSLETFTMVPPEGGTAVSAAWLMGGDLLVDYVATPGAAESQRWARAEVGSSPPWPEVSADPVRARLFMYAPYREGLIYTLYPGPAEYDWTIFVLEEISAEAQPRAIPVEAVGDGAARIVRVP